MFFIMPSKVETSQTIGFCGNVLNAIKKINGYKNIQILLCKQALTLGTESCESISIVFIELTDCIRDGAMVSLMWPTALSTPERNRGEMGAKERLKLCTAEDLFTLMY